ncbi:MarR family winged helix-turn-helix transcriptional regulator [Kutzneria sp. CA-103260]|uniref:MarR family winged helix-turn-helix transcriptional regulator n=1 Tax=Kutzneria sp. CA-103260 TaxID=2802641 RepID=UPI001BAA8230|nr:MarR family transcriptional regulator [Kutzneria sp. CA-103260]QUQ72151.1 MarR family transcriptional regulator [Kutzneria sp. CA-103260]
MDDTADGCPLDLAALLPRLTQLGALANRSHMMERIMEQAGIALDRPAMTVLITVETAGHPLRVGEIAKRMQVVGPHVTRVLHDLERRDLARRVPDPDDRRAQLIELTPTGSATARRYLHTVLGWITEAMADWPAPDRQTFSRLLTRFLDDLAARLSAIE